MSPRRPAAPELPGFTPVRLLGTGGFADVHLYQEGLPQRQVAVKVLHDGFNAHTAAAFTAEANVMARLSAHPAIVTIFQAGIASDGRPYLVMEYYPRPNLQVRSRQQPLSVADTLDITIRICGAVEAAHRAGIIHRDIKPGNILMSAYNKPGLSDFGIAAAKWGMSDDESGLSIPWCAPEVIEGRTTGDERTDVYSLAATVYTLLAGRSPFDAPGGRNGHVDLLARITNGSPAPLERADMPVGLKRILSMGLDRNPSHRPSSAAELARLLQEVEVQLHLAVTPLEVPGEAQPLATPDDGEDPTRVRGATVVRPRTALQRRTDTRPVGSRQPSAHEAAVGLAAQLASPGGEPNSVAVRSRRGLLAMSAAVCVAAIIAILTFTRLTPQGAPPAGDEQMDPSSAVLIGVPTPTGLAITRDGPSSATAEWDVADPQPEDAFQWERTDPDGTGQRGVAHESRLLLDGLAPAERPCLNVWLVRRGITSDSPASACEGA